MNKAGSHSGEKRIRAKFEPEEDELLKQLVNKYGSDWVKISGFMEGRNVRQCRERWSHYLCSDTAKRPWTPEEDKILLQTVKDIGTKWCKVITHLNDRTDIQAKTRWLRLTNRKTIHDKSPPFSPFTSSQVPFSNETTRIEQPINAIPNSVNSLQKPIQNQQRISSDLHQPIFPSLPKENPAAPEETGSISFPFNLFSDEIPTNIEPKSQFNFEDKLNMFSLDSKDSEKEISLLFFPDSNYSNGLMNNSFIIDEYI